MTDIICYDHKRDCFDIQKCSSHCIQYFKSINVTQGEIIFVGDLIKINVKFNYLLLAIQIGCKTIDLICAMWAV